MAADFAKPANAELVQLQIDPHELGGVFRLMTAKSFQVYKNTWLDFTQFAGISVEKIPKEEDFARFFEMKRNAGLSKQRGHVKMSKFLVPRGKTSSGICFAQLIEEYQEALRHDKVDMGPEAPFIYTGRPATDAKPSKFIKSRKKRILPAFLK